MTKRIVPDDVKLEVYDTLRDLERRLLGGTPSWEFAKPRLAATAKGQDYAAGAKNPAPKRNLAQEERGWWYRFYNGLPDLGLGSLEIPLPGMSDLKNKTGTRIIPASNRLFDRWGKSNSGLINIPRTDREFYERFARAVGQPNHWSLTKIQKESGQEGIVWDKLTPGWKRVDIAPDCPRLETPWNQLNREVALIALLEYWIAWYSVKRRTGVMLDPRTRTWLKTRYQYADGRLGALNALEYGGGVCVNCWRSGHLDVPCDDFGGRAAEVVPAVA